MIYEVKTFISTQRDVVNELIEVVDLLNNRDITHAKFEELISTYMFDYFDLIVKKLDETTVQINGAARKNLGKKRLLLVSKCLERHEIAKLDNAKDGIFTLIEKSG